VATKKCPKCGEENPAEAVMCWACYTPLAGGAAAAAGGGLVAPRGGVASVTPAATAARQNEEKKGVDPKIFLVVGLLLVALVIGGFTTGIFGGAPADAGLPIPEPKPGKTTGGTTRPPTNPTTPNINVIVPDAPVPSSPTDGGVVVKHYDVVVAPNPRYPIGTIGIVAVQPDITPAQAVSLGKFAKNQFAANGRWNRLQVVVFNNGDVGKAFLKYQAKRQNLSLSSPQFQDMAQSGMWSSVPAYIEFGDGKDRVYEPSRSPTNWWTGS